MKALPNLKFVVSNGAKAMQSTQRIKKIVLLQYFVYGNKELLDDLNKELLELTVNFIHKTGRLGWLQTFVFYTTQPLFTFFPISFVSLFHI